MEIFLNTFNQTLLLFLLILAGYLLVKLGVIPPEGSRILSKLENSLIIPALVMTTFMKNFTPDKLSEYGKLFLLSFALWAVIMPIAIICSRWIYKDAYRRKIALYGLSFANFGFMGNAVVLAVYGSELFAKYSVFVIPLWTMIYLWGVPTLLLSDDADGGEKGDTRVKKLLKKLKPLVNPMFVGMLLGMVIGITGLGELLPAGNFFSSAIEQTGACMSVIAMLITGMTVASCNFAYIIKNVRIYILSAVRLIVIPLIFIAVFALVPKNGVTDETFLTCAICAISMPLGLNTIVVPGAYGRDTSDAAGMALISHVLAVVTIPLVFTVFEKLVI